MNIANADGTSMDVYLRFRTTTPEGEWSETQEEPTSADSVEFALADLTANTEYEVQASLENTFPEDASPSTTFTTTSTVPGAPQNVAATPGGAELVVTWEAPEDGGGSPVTGYIVQWKSGDEEFDTEREEQVDGETLTYAISDLDTDIEYTVQVLASNENGSGAPSETATGTPLAVVGSMIDAVSVESDGPTTAKVTVTVSSATEDEPVTVQMRYRIASEPNGGEGGSAGQPEIEQVGISQQAESGEWSEIQSVETTTGVAEFTLTDLDQDEEYEIQVSLEETFSDDAFVSSITFKPAKVPSAPTGVVLIPGDAEISVSWSPPADDGGSPITENIVQWKSGDEEFDSTRQAQVDVEDLMYTIEGLTNGVEYDVQVTSVNVVGEGEPSAGESATPTAAAVTTIAQVRILNVLQTSATAEITVANRDTSVTTTVYIRYRATTTQQAWNSITPVNAVTHTVEFILSGLTAGTSYEVQVSLDDSFPEDARVSVTFDTQRVPQPPRITSARSFTVNEGETKVATLTAADADTPASQLAWSILPSSMDGDKFTLSGMGALYFRSAKDYKNPDDANGDGTYELTVQVRDDQNTDSAVIQVTLRDVMEGLTPTPPIAANYQAARYSVAEGNNVSVSVVLSSSHRQQVSIPILVISGGTAESGDYRILGLSNNTLSIPQGQLSRSFTVATNEDSDTDDETIRLGFGALPQGVSVGSVRITTITIIDEDVASDTGGSSRRGISARNSPPRFIEHHNAIRSIAENSPPGTEVGEPVAATDADLRDQDSLTYSLAGVDVNSFSINSASGQILTDALLDFERKAGYTVVVLVRDGRGGNDIISVSIVVTDINEPPLVSGAASIDFAENSTEVVSRLSATDPEGMVTLTLSLSGEDSEAFTIEEDGTLRFRVSPDFENPTDANEDNIYLVTVEASDRHSAGALDSSIEITDAEEQGQLSLPIEVPRIGMVLTALLTEQDIGISDTVWMWERSSDGSNWLVIPGAESSEYTPVEKDEGTYLRVTATYSDVHGSVKSLQATTESPVQQVPQAVATSVPTRRPTAEPTTTPTHLPMVVPTLEPSPSPTPVPVVVRTSLPAAAPTATAIPTRTPTAVPTVRPTATAVPTAVEAKTSVSQTATPMATEQPSVRDAEDSEVPINPLVLLLIAALVGIASIALVIRIRRRRA